MKFLKRTHFHVLFLFIFVFLIFSIIIQQPVFSQPLPADDTIAQKSTEDSPKKDIIFGDGTYNQFGISAGAVSKNDYDTGFGFGLKVKRPLNLPHLELALSGYLWGASIDSLDVTSLGIEQELTYNKTFKTGITFFSGIVAGYFVTNDREEAVIANETKIIEKNKATFEAYLTYGASLPAGINRSLFAQVKYGVTQPKPEIHILIGMYFSKQ